MLKSRSEPWTAPKVFTPQGSDVGYKYAGVTTPDGGRIRKVVGEYSISEYIKSFEDSCLLETILKKCAVTGDLSSLNTRDCSFVDLTGVPRDFAEVQSQLLIAHSAYDSLSSDLKAKYPSFESFSDAMLSDPDSDVFTNLLSDLGVSVPEPTPTSTSTSTPTPTE